MSYVNSLSNKNKLSVEYSRFVVKLVFSALVVLSLMYLEFLYTYVILIGLFILGTIFYKYFADSKNRFSQFILGIEKEYQNGFSGKEPLVSLMGFIVTFAVVFILNYFVVFPLEWSLILGLMVLGVGNNFASIILYFKKSQYFVYGTTIEYFILSGLLNFLILWFVGLPWLGALFIAICISVFFILPWLDHNLTTVLVTAILYILLFI